MNTTENNRLIAEFMGGVLIYPTTCNYGVFKFSKEDKYKLTSDTEPTTENGIAQGLLKFHKSWDWLMPVAEKINSTGRFEVIIKYGFCYITDTEDELTLSCPIKNTFNAVYQAVVNFIQWYNNQDYAAALIQDEQRYEDSLKQIR